LKNIKLHEKTINQIKLINQNILNLQGQANLILETYINALGLEGKFTLDITTWELKREENKDL